MTGQELRPSERQRSLKDILGNTSVAIHTLSKMTEKLEDEMLENIVQLKATPAIIASLQSMDLLIQSISEIALLLERLSGSVAPDIVVNVKGVTAAIRLEQLRNLIDPSNEVPEVDEATAINLDVALF